MLGFLNTLLFDLKLIVFLIHCFHAFENFYHYIFPHVGGVNHFVAFKQQGLHGFESFYLVILFLLDKLIYVSQNRIYIDWCQKYHVYAKNINQSLCLKIFQSVHYSWFHITPMLIPDKIWPQNRVQLHGSYLD